MKVIIEKEYANILSIDDKEYRVLKNFNAHEPLGLAIVTLENGVLYADLKLTKNVKGYPSIMYTRGDKPVLVCIGISDVYNLDESIEEIEYIQQIEGKPSNLKTK